jgi:hypothetical protein
MTPPLLVLVLSLAAMPAGADTSSADVAPPTEKIRVEGRVLDAFTGKPIAGARVVAAERRAQTDEEGRFALLLPVGEWKLAVEAEGYAPDATTVTLAAGGIPRPFEFALIDRDRFREEVEVTAEGAIAVASAPAELPVTHDGVRQPSLRARRGARREPHRDGRGRDPQPLPALRPDQRLQPGDR